MSNLELIKTAVKSLGYSVTVADVAVKTGLPLETTNSLLNDLAAATHATLKVSNIGHIVYVFPHSSFNISNDPDSFSKLWLIVSYMAFFLLRVSFGLVILAPVAIISACLIGAILIIFAMGAIVADHIMLAMGLTGVFLIIGLTLGADIARLIGTLPFSFHALGGLSRFFSFQTKQLANGLDTEYENEVFEGTSKTRLNTGFANDVFAYAFGIGINRKHRENAKWACIAQLLRNNNSAVIEEQLAPYSGNYLNDDNDIFNVLVKFDGRPEVSQNGTIVYVFPHLDVSAIEWPNIKLPPYFSEDRMIFCGLDGMQLIRIYCFALFNLLLAFCLERNGLLSVELKSFEWFIHLFAFYACLFFAVPLLRLLIHFAKNAYIDQRNEYRCLLSQLLANADENLCLKLRDARQFALMSEIPSQRVIEYSTDRDILEQ